MEYQRASAATAFSKKLSNGQSFNGKNMYDGVFGGQSKVGSRVEDYAEIFGGGSGSSIPVLDVPELSERKFSVDVSSSKLDYANIFGGFGDFGVSHEEFIAKPARDTKTSAKTRSYSEGSFPYPSNIPAGNQVLSNDPTSLESGNAVKQFKMSYNKSIPGGKNGTNGTTHVAKLHAVPGYSCLIDEQVTPSRDKPAFPLVNQTNPTNNSGEGLVEGIHKKSASNIPPGGVSKQTLENVDGLLGKSRSYVSDFSDVLFGSYDVGHKTPPTKVPRAASMSNNIGSNKRDSMKFGVSRSYSLDGDAGVSSPPYFDDEVDANSVAATSAAAVKKAIEEAQARLRVAKELMERRKEGYATHIKPRCNGGLKGEKRKKAKDTIKDNVRQDKAQETNQNIDAYVQTSEGLRKQNVTKVGQAVPESEDRKKFFTTREAAGGTYAKSSMLSEGDCRQEDAGKKEKAKEGERETEVMQALNEYEGEEKKIMEKQEKNGEKSEVVEEVPEEKVERKLDASNELYDKIECLNELKSDAQFHGQKEDETKLRFAEQCEEAQERMPSELDACDRTLTEQDKPTENGRRVDNVETRDIDNMETQKFAQDIDNVETHGIDNIETQKVAQDIDNVETYNNILKVEEDGSGLQDVFGKEDNEMLEMLLQDVSLQKEFEKRSEETFEMSELMRERKGACGAEEIKKEEEGASNREDNEQMFDEMEKPEIIDLTHNDFDKEEERQRRLEEKCDLLGDEEFMEAKENGDMFEDAYQMEPAEEQKEAPESVGTEEMQKQTDQEADETTQAREDVLGCYQEDLEVANDSDEENHIKNFVETMEASKREASCQMTPQLLVNEEIDRIVEESKDDIECKEARRNSDAVEVANGSEENLACDKAGFTDSNSKFDEIEQELQNTTESFDFDRNSTDTDTADRSFEDKQYEQTSEESDTICNMEKHVQELVYESIEDVREAEVVTQEECKYKLEFPDERRWAASQLDCNFGEKHVTTQIAHGSESSPSTVNNQDTLTKEVRERKNNFQKEVELVKKQQRRVDEAKEREREREKERIAVERAIREARERAFAEARERAAAERKIVEARRKEKGEAQGEAAKPSAEAVDKTYMEAKLKAERAAVERATAEARQRALEKALSEKASFGTRNQAEKVSHAKQSFQSYDSRNKGQSPATGRYPNSSNQSASHSSEGLNGATAESAQRCKARLERHQRTAERASKALAEKNKRDLLAQKEQAERNRLAETLDAEVKRWSSGKHGNLRALLSTLQYILGPDSGWQPIQLTEMIATAAVKKAYRKATLCVHPDKLQQRGASIRQKYICEKVFDLLKEAWNRFGADER